MKLYVCNRPAKLCHAAKPCGCERFRAIENLTGADDRHDDRILSKPLDTLADEIKKVDD